MTLGRYPSFHLRSQSQSLALVWPTPRHLFHPLPTSLSQALVYVVYVVNDAGNSTDNILHSPCGDPSLCASCHSSPLTAGVVLLIRLVGALLLPVLSPARCVKTQSPKLLITH